MKWSPQQDAALVAVDEWLRNPGDKQVFRLFGYAGTGKTTLAMHLASGVNGRVLFGAFTGKAAHVLQQKGCPEASTIHRMIYKPKDKSREELVRMERELEERLEQLKVQQLDPEFTAANPDFDPEDDEKVAELRAGIKREKQNLKRPAFALNEESEVQFAKLVVIDECSMVDGDMAGDLLSFGAPVLVLGDPAQLPPVGKGAGYFTDATPDIMLSEIHRQALDNPIVRMATDTRQHKPLPLGKYGESEVVSGRIDPELALSMDQVLVGRNRTRHATNDRVRSLLGYKEPHPVRGDKLVCLRNNHDKGLLNGALWHCEDVGDVDEFKIVMTVRSEDNNAPAQVVEAHMGHFYRNMEDMSWWERKTAEEFDYGYALTVHKSQGSQWDKVLLVDESKVFGRRNPADKWRWLYTGITRAAEKVIISR